MTFFSKIKISDIRFRPLYFISKDGGTAIEYALIASAIAVGIAAIVFGLGTTLDGTFTTISGKLSSSGAP